ncbi:MAG TPA: Spy/CpxP family protein refolding chaperone [Alphaproteobacteria bacterium]
MSQITIASRVLGAAALASILLLGTPLTADAQNSTVTPSTSNPPATAQAPAPGATAKPRRGGANSVEQRIADLHKRLQITPAQEDQWKQVAAVMRQNASDVEAVIKERAQNYKNMTAVDDLRSYEKISEVHEDGMKRLIPAFQSLYDSMSDTQKKNADNVFRSHQRRAARANQAS